MATTKAQRIGIWIIAGFMAVGTIGSFAIIVLANSNDQKDQARLTQLTAEYQKKNQAYCILDIRVVLGVRRLNLF